jgi:Mn2+/Fe2+ NRAMP family transporter
LNVKRFIQTLGPGVLFASTAIGVSHLVQSTKAGAEYGFALVVFILAANFFKWPFFEFGSRYATATGRSLIDGYHKLSPWILRMYLVVTLLSMFFVTSAVTFVAAGFLQNLFSIEVPSHLYYLPSLVLFAFCVIVLAVGRFAALDAGIKIIATVMLVSTLAAFIISLIKGPTVPLEYSPFSELVSIESLPFIIALMGWMPTAVDLSTWNSLWTIERIKQSGYKPAVKETVFEFNVGYWVSGALSLCFVVLGAYLVYGTGKTMPDKSAAFASEVVNLYTSNLGTWTWPIIAAAGFSIMLGTCFGVLDGYARAMSRIFHLLHHQEVSQRNYTVWLLLTASGGFCVIAFFISEFNKLVQVATIISFLIAPFIAVLNYTLVFGSHLKDDEKPGRFMRYTAIAGIAFLLIFSVVFVFFN